MFCSSFLSDVPVVIYEGVDASVLLDDQPTGHWQLTVLLNMSLTEGLNHSPYGDVELEAPGLVLLILYTVSLPSVPSSRQQQQLSPSQDHHICSH